MEDHTVISVHYSIRVTVWQCTLKRVVSTSKIHSNTETNNVLGAERKWFSS